MDSSYPGPAYANDFTNADIEGSYVPGLPTDSLKQTKNYRQGRLRGIRIFDDVTGLSFKNMSLDACYLAGRDDTCEGSDFTNASLRRMVITPGFSEQQIRSTENGQRHDYTELLFSGSASVSNGIEQRDFTRWDFSLFELGYFINCDLTNSCFNDAFFLSPAHLYTGVMTERFEVTPWTYYENVKSAYIGFDGCILSEDQMRQTMNWDRKDLRGIHLRNMNLDGWDFSEMNLENADLSGSSLKNAKFVNANIKGLRIHRCTGVTLEQLQQTTTLRERDTMSIIADYRLTNFEELTDEQRALQESFREE